MRDKIKNLIERAISDWKRNIAVCKGSIKKFREQQMFPNGDLSKSIDLLNREIELSDCFVRQLEEMLKNGEDNETKTDSMGS